LLDKSKTYVDNLHVSYFCQAILNNKLQFKTVLIAWLLNWGTITRWQRLFLAWAGMFPNHLLLLSRNIVVPFTQDW